MLNSQLTCEKCGAVRTLPSMKLAHGVRYKCSKCDSVIHYKKNISFPSRDSYAPIEVQSFVHPLDRAALAVLKKVPGLSQATKFMMKFSYEKYVRVSELADDVRVTQRTYGYIHDMVQEASKVMGIPAPSVYINQHPVPNGYTTCVEQPVIVLTSGLVEMCDDDELYVAISHEVGHIKCEHVLYHMLAHFLGNFPDLLGITKLITAGVNLALLEWYRKSELSADRAAIIITNNKAKVISLLMKLAGGTGKLAGMVDYADFISQYKEWEELIKGVSNRMIYRFSTLFRSHPFPIVRAHEIEIWADMKDQCEQVHPGECV